MREQIIFGDSWIECEIPEGTQIVPPGISLALEPVPDLTVAVRAALDDPIDSPPLEHLARGKSRITVAFDDPTVPCYAPVWNVAIKEVLSDLDRAGVAEQSVTLLCANALHRKFTHDELAKLIGQDLVSRFRDRLLCHDAESHPIPIGVTAEGHHVDLSKFAVESDLVVYVNCSTTRGFSGGWKSICVGLSSYRSISHHHTPDTMSMSIEKNRMHAILDQMGEVAEKTLGRDRFFKIETVLANPLQPAAIFAGSVAGCRARALALNRANMPNRRELLDEKVDVVAYGVPDWSPYAAFSYTNPLLTLVSTGLGYLGGMIEALGKPGCAVVLATPCPDRWDVRSHPSYPEVWEHVIQETKDPFVARERFEGDFAAREEYVHKYQNEFGFHGSHGIMALYPLKRLRHASRVIVGGADARLVRHVGFEHAESFERGLAESVVGKPDASIALVRYPAAFNRQ